MGEPSARSGLAACALAARALVTGSRALAAHAARALSVRARVDGERSALGRGAGRAVVGDERGAASVLAVALLGVLGAAVVFGVRYGEVVVGRHRVVAAADLAAVAAAGWIEQGAARACGRAEWVVRRMGGELVSCVVSGVEVVVEVRAARGKGLGSVFGAPAARARAGSGEG
ncbi:Rv3654c family TadE-like protein [Actinosynnema sp. NPDC047251]|uniref:Putative secreted protein n=1 Tax=Saccharothrix espanaensis (strain ATCC 51144 / DSM 44229 / JCM 9112 / NBRC 15066 / NRRL 15764) TaxID=1179773 RepID=K0JQ51_SACES|nr:Rv3654c family TadE-like protein [Saccharothrix espanaensis]CCH27656.1 putative secreted protein [Saccharothrix espanaensis DSM 44229]